MKQYHGQCFSLAKRGKTCTLALEYNIERKDLQRFVEMGIDEVHYSDDVLFTFVK